MLIVEYSLYKISFTFVFSCLDYTILITNFLLFFRCNNSISNDMKYLLNNNVIRNYVSSSLRDYFA